MPYVAPEGSVNSRIAIIGEGLGAQEYAQERAFVGPSGRLLWHTLAQCDVYRSECWIANVIPDAIITDPLSTLGHHELEAYINDIKSRIAGTNCNVYIALGRTALYALTGEQSITNWRGTIIQTRDGHKCVPSLHTAYILRSPSQYFYFQRDIRVAVAQSEFPEIELPKRTLNFNPSLNEFREFIREIMQSSIVTCDIETDTNSIITCLSLCVTPDYAMSIPLFAGGQRYWGDKSFIEVYTTLAKMFASPTLIKEFHNGSFDTGALRIAGLPVSPPLRDTMYKHHVLNPVAPPGISQKPHSLATISSYYTLQPFYKDWDAKDRTMSDKKVGVPQRADQSIDEYNRANREYNAIDASVTREISLALDAQFTPAQHKLYERHHSRLQPYLIKMRDDGICVDIPLAKQLATSLREQASRLEDGLSNAIGERVTVNSHAKLKHILYDVLKCPAQFNRDSHRRKVLTSDDEALVQIHLQTQGSSLGTFALQLRDAKEWYKYASFLDPLGRSAQKKRNSLKWDGRMHTEYKPTTKTCRLASSGTTATRTGTNLQNIPSFVRQVFVPASGYIFLEPDYRQAEAMVVAYDSCDIDMMHKFALAREDPLGYDIHYANAEIILAQPRSHLTREDRSACKHIVYGSYYLMKERKLQETILKLAVDTTKPYNVIPGMKDEYAPLYVSLSDCRKRQERFIAEVPAVTAWQSRIEHALRATGKLTNAFGFTVTYHDVIIDNDLKWIFGNREKDFHDTLKEALAMIPQSTIGILCCQSLMNIEDDLREQSLGRVVAQVHDSLLLEIRDDWPSLEAAFNIAKQRMEREVIIKNNKLIVPVEFKCGYSWRCEADKIFTLEDLWKSYQKLSSGV